MYLTALVFSNPLLAANNKGEGTGNVQTLQQITTPNGVRTVLSGYSIKRAIRDSMIAQGAKMWRKLDPSFSGENPAGYTYGDNAAASMVRASPPSPIGYADEQFGFMAAPKAEKGVEKSPVLKLPGAFECSVAVSTTNYSGDMAFVQGLKADSGLNPFSSERHYTRYQFTVTWDLRRVDPESFRLCAEALRSLAVGGSHSSNATEVTPDQIIWALHKVPGRAGLQVGMGDVFPPDETLDLTRILEKALELGVSTPHQNSGGRAITEMIVAATPHCKQA